MNENLQKINQEKTLKFLTLVTNDSGGDFKLSYLKNLINEYPNILELMLNDKTPDLSKVKYIKHKRYSQLKAKVLAYEHLLELNEKLKNCFDFNVLKKLYEHYIVQSNEFEVIDIIYKAIKNQPYDTLYHLDRIGFKTADSILLTANNNPNNLWEFDLKTSVFRCISFIIYYLNYELNGSTWIYTETLKKLMLTKYEMQDCVDKFEQALADPRLYVSKNRVMLTYYYFREQFISNYAKKCIYTQNTQNEQNWLDIDVSKYSQLEMIQLTNTQLQTLNLITKNQMVLLNGYAGTGKSSSIKALINLLDDNNFTYKILAPTAKAAKTIASYTDRKASTIHHFLCEELSHIVSLNFDDNIADISSESLEQSGINFYFDYDIIIIDECSMLSVSLFYTLIRYMNHNRTKLLLIGDSYQLPSIQHGNLYHDLLSINEIPKVTLNEIFRYDEDGLVNVATNIRHGKKYLHNDSYEIIGNSYSFFHFNDNEELLGEALGKYLELVEKDGKENVAILTPKNIGPTGTYLINNCIQQIINPLDVFENEITITVDNNQINFRNNDLVMNVKNAYGMDSVDGEVQGELISNGEIGIIKNIDYYAKSMIIEFDGVEFMFDSDHIQNLRLAYCFTVHKSQGSQFKKVIYLTTKNDSFMLSSNILYVGVTRAELKCYHYGDSFTVNSKVGVRENLKRNTSLVEQFYNKF